MNQAATITRPEFATTDALAASVNRLAQPALPDPLDAGIAQAVDALLAQQQADGHWVYELEADATIPAEYILMVHYLGEPADPVLEGKIANYLRRIQNADGGWPLFHAGPPTSAPA